MATRTAKKPAAPAPQPKVAPSTKKSAAPVVGRDDDHREEDGTTYHVSIKNGFSGLFTAESKDEARQKYIKHFGVISTEHKIVVQEATEDQIAEEQEKKDALENGKKDENNSGDENDDGGSGDEDKE